MMTNERIDLLRKSVNQYGVLSRVSAFEVLDEVRACHQKIKEIGIQLTDTEMILREKNKELGRLTEQANQHHHISHEALRNSEPVENEKKAIRAWEVKEKLPREILELAGNRYYSLLVYDLIIEDIDTRKRYLWRHGDEFMTRFEPRVR